MINWKIINRGISPSLIFLASTAAFSAKAGNSYGLVQQVIVGGNIAYVSIVGASIAGGNYNGCANNQRYVVDLTSQTGRAMYAMVLGAKLAGVPLTVLGANNCNLMGGADAEGVNNTLF